MSKRSVEDAHKSIQGELDETSRGLREVTLMLEQSRERVSMLTQRNAGHHCTFAANSGASATVSLEELRMA